MNAEMNDLLMRVETRVRQLILKHRELQAKKKSLEEEIAALALAEEEADVDGIGGEDAVD